MDRVMAILFTQKINSSFYNDWICVQNSAMLKKQTDWINNLIHFFIWNYSNIHTQWTRFIEGPQWATKQHPLYISCRLTGGQITEN